MAHRQYHEQEVESLRRSVKEESEAKVGLVCLLSIHNQRMEGILSKLFGSMEGQVRQAGSRTDVAASGRTTCSSLAALRFPL